MIKKEPLLSIIVPVYKTEKYLTRCLDSIMNQTYKHLEIIIVNDASPDNSISIITEYAKKDNRFVILNHSENQGLFQARITGIEAARGEYFAFVDSDDCISVDYYRLMIDKARELEADIVLSDFVNLFDDKRYEYFNLDPIRLSDLNLCGEHILNAFMTQKGLFFGWHTVWNKIYSLALWKRCRMLLIDFSKTAGHLTMTEDIAFSCVFWSFAKKVVNVHNAYYFYFRHDNQSISVSNVNRYKKCVNDIAKVFNFFKNVLIMKGSYIKYQDDYTAYKVLYHKYWSNNLDRLTKQEKKDAKQYLFSQMQIDKLMPVSQDDDYFYHLKTECSKTFNDFEEIKKAIVSNNTEYVSFDIFDTLIFRPLFSPADLYKFLNIEFNRLLDKEVLIDFPLIRINAEDSQRRILKAQNPACEDVNLDEIYDFIKTNYCFTDEVIETIKRREIELELDFCTARKTAYELYELARYHDKKIIFISDMYLPGDVVSQILLKNEYEGELFLSSETRFLKSSGNLYKYALSKLGITADQLVHIGDNLNSDIKAATKLGIRAFHLPRTIDLFTGQNPFIYSGKSYEKAFGIAENSLDARNPDANNFGIRCMLALVANKIFDNPFIPFNQLSDFNGNAYYIGYYALGMHLYAVTNWLLDGTKETKNIHFVMRDGYLPMQAFSLLTNLKNNQLTVKTLNFTRKSVINFLLSSPENILSLTKQIAIEYTTPKKIITLTKKIIDKDKLEKIEKLLKNENIEITKPFTGYDSFLLFANFFQNELLDIKAAEKYRNNFIKHASAGFLDDDALFDLGYSGRNELFIAKLLKRKVNSFYIHDNSDDLRVRQVLGGFKTKTFYDHKPTMCVIIREHLFAKMEPSCTGFNIEDDDLKPVYETYNHNYQTDYITGIIQNAALDFVRDMEATFNRYKEGLIYKNLCASIPYEFYMSASTDFDMRIFDSSYFEDDVLGGRDINFYNFWKNDRNNAWYNPAIPSNAESFSPSVSIDYDRLFPGKQRWKRVVFMLLCDKKVFIKKLKRNLRWI